jgi:hypothetical protein
MSSQAATKKESAYFTVDDLHAYLGVLVENQASAGDGGNFPAKVWKAVSQKLEPMRKKGGPKTQESCRTKWSHVRDFGSLEHKTAINTNIATFCVFYVARAAQQGVRFHMGPRVWH